MISGKVTEKFRAWWQRRVALMTLMLAFGLFALGGIVFFVISGYFFLRTSYTPWQAGLIIGGSMLVFAIIGIVGLQLSSRRSTPPRHYNHSSASPTQSKNAQVDVVTQLGRSIGASLNQHNIRTTDVMIAALVAGTVLGASPALRERLWRRKHRPSSQNPSSIGRSRARR